MKKEEAINFLRFKKVFVKGFSEQIQKQAFTLGWEWQYVGKSVNHLEAPFLFFNDVNDGNLLISAGASILDFYQSELDEIPAEDILNLIIDAANFRPFSDHQECWKEMLMHSPFGWIKAKSGSEYCSFKRISTENNFEYIFNCYVFADGTPFGIKQ